MNQFSLTPRQTRTALDVLTGLVVISVGISMAGLTWRFFGHAGTGAITMPAVRSGPMVAPDIAPALALAPFGKPSASEAAQATTLPLELKGVVAAIPASLSTAFISVSGAAPTVFHVGEQVSGASIEAILRDRVILSNGGQSQYLAFPDPSLSPQQRQAAAQQASAPPPPSPSPVAAAPSPIAPPQSPAGASAQASILQRFDAQPVRGGFRIGDNGPPGMSAGDVIESVNGTSLSDPNAANAAFAAAQASGSAQIQVLRDGKRMTLTVPLR